VFDFQALNAKSTRAPRCRQPQISNLQSIPRHYLNPAPPILPTDTNSVQLQTFDTWNYNPTKLQFLLKHPQPSQYRLANCLVVVASHAQSRPRRRAAAAHHHDNSEQHRSPSPSVSSNTPCPPSPSIGTYTRRTSRQLSSFYLNFIAPATLPHHTATTSRTTAQCLPDKEYNSGGESLTAAGEGE
jgi:hypothetical protein